jgi:hypothetical protein
MFLQEATRLQMLIALGSKAAVGKPPGLRSWSSALPATVAKEKAKEKAKAKEVASWYTQYSSVGELVTCIANAQSEYLLLVRLRASSCMVRLRASCCMVRLLASVSCVWCVCSFTLFIRGAPAFPHHREPCPRSTLSFT